MDRLGSCYFCGTALDAPLAEEPVVPEDLGADRERTVTLCPTCSRKVEAVMDEVRGALDEGSTGVDPSSASGSSTAVDSASERDPATGPNPAAEGESAPSDPLESSAGEEESTESTAEEGSTSAEARSERSADDEPTPDPSASPPHEEDEEEAATTTTVSQEDATPAATDPSTGEAESEAEEEAAEGGRTISALENSKVMRMLENREFPVERDSFQAVAANAYGVGEAQVAQVLDMAIDRGLLAESDGMLVRPD
jgi:hypothetical protein